jgi:hypothetical protein
MTCPELIQAMAVKGYWMSPAGKTPAATLAAALARGDQGPVLGTMIALSLCQDGVPRCAYKEREVEMLRHLPAGDRSIPARRVRQEQALVLADGAANEGPGTNRPS